jgi:hypothetical protein
MQRTGSWQAFDSHHPDVAAVSAAVTPVLFINLAVEDEPLRSKVLSMTEHAEKAASAPSMQEADEEREKLEREMSDVITSLGEQLRRLS